MPKVTLNGTVLAESNDTTIVENNHYFPPSAIKSAFFTQSQSHTYCPWKGTASYYNVSVDGQTIDDAAWYYPDAYEKAKHIEGYIAFYQNKVTIE